LQSVIKDKNMYAQFDSTAPQPTPVTGWHETMTPAAQLVLPANLLTLTQEQWDNRLNTPFISGGVLVAAPAPTVAQLLSTAQSTQIAAIESAYQAAIQQPVAYMNTTFQADKDSQDVLTKCLVAGSVPSGFYWLDENNAQVVMTFAQLQGLASAILVQGQAAFAHLQAKKSAVKAVTTTVADVQAIVW
jgi:hypothetical protein